jgi:hypothetical protein
MEWTERRLRTPARRFCVLAALSTTMLALAEDEGRARGSAALVLDELGTDGAQLDVHKAAATSELIQRPPTPASRPTGSRARAAAGCCKSRIATIGTAKLRFMAQRIHATTVEVKRASHVVMIPARANTKLILAAAALTTRHRTGPHRGPGALRRRPRARRQGP